MEKILSVIIPTYNMENYLRTCLDSLLIKDGFDSLEVLVINDGSKDNSSNIAHEYEERYPNVFRVIDKVNGNYGSCVNRGLKEATGKYIKILDADDSFETNNFETYITFLKNNNVDLVLNDFAVTNTDRGIVKIIHYDFNNQLFPCNMNVICTLPLFKNGIQMHAVTYRRRCLIDMSYKQTERISYTDQQWIFIPMIAIQTVAYFNRYVYKYLIGRNGQTMDPQIKLKNIKHTEICSLEMVKAYEQNKEKVIGKPIQEYIYARLISYVKSVYVFYLSHYSTSNASLLTNYDSQLKKMSAEVYELISDKKVSSIFGFQYITYWRNSPKCPVLIINILSSIYKLLLRCKAILRPEDKMAIPTSI